MPDDDAALTPSIGRRTFVAGVGAGAAGGLAGCSSPASDGDGDDGPLLEQPADPPTGGRLTYGLPDAPRTLNILRATSPYEFEILEKVHAAGTALDPRKRHDLPAAISPWTVADYEVHPENVDTGSPAITATLREDVTFSDGTPLTAGDYKFTVDYIQEQQPSGVLNAAQFAAVDEVVVDSDDGYQVDVHLSRPDYRWHSFILGTPILPKHVWRDVSDHTQYQPRTEGLVGAGPMTLEEFTWGESFSLDFRPREEVPWPRADYVDWLHDDAPFLDGVDLAVYGSANALEGALFDGDVDAVLGGVDADRVPDASDDERLAVLQSPGLRFTHVSTNVRRVPLDDHAFRQFLVLLTDKTWIVEDLYRGVGADAGDYVTHPDFEATRPPAPGETDAYDGIPIPDLSFPGEAGTFTLDEDAVEAARQFLVEHDTAVHDYRFEAGDAEAVTGDRVLHVRPDGAGEYRPLGEVHTDNAGEAGQGPLDFSYQPAGEDRVQHLTGDELVSSLRRVGVPVSPTVESVAAQRAKIYVREDFDLYSMGWELSAYQTHFAGLYSSEQADVESANDQALLRNSMGYTGADEAIFADRATMDYGERTETIKRVCAKIYHDAPTNVTAYVRLLEPVNRDFGGFYATPGGIGNQSLMNVFRRDDG